MTLNIQCEYTELVDINALKPNPKNPNKHPPEQIERLAKIIEYQGMRSPIVVSELSGFITKGQVAELRLDSLPDVPLTGKVVEVSEYPLPPISVYMSHVKEYEVSIQIDNPPLDLRPGMTAEAKILVDRMDDVLQLPIEAIQERGEKFYCAIPLKNGSIETRELRVGKANETSLIVESGLEVGEEVVLNISDEGILERMDFPEISTL